LERSSSTNSGTAPSSRGSSTRPRSTSSSSLIVGRTPQHATSLNSVYRRLICSDNRIYCQLSCREQRHHYSNSTVQCPLSATEPFRLPRLAYYDEQFAKPRHFRTFNGCLPVAPSPFLHFRPQYLTVQRPRSDTVSFWKLKSFFVTY